MQNRIVSLESQAQDEVRKKPDMDTLHTGRTGPAQVAVLGTLAEFHKEPIPYDLSALVRLVTTINPDLLCLDIDPRVWQERDFDRLPPEYREALLPLAYQTDMVVVPIGGNDGRIPLSMSGWRGGLIAWLRTWLAAIQRQSPGPEAVNHGLRHEVANLLYHTVLLLSGSGAFDQRQHHTERLIQRTLEVARSNPAARILVVVNVQYCHIIRPRLRPYSEVGLVRYTAL